MQDPVTQRFLECYTLLKERGAVRSARQFALSIDMFPQSFNEILKGRREVTIKLLRLASTQYSINASYVLAGIGKCLMDNSNAYNLDDSVVPVICPHKHHLYAQGQLDINQVDHWALPRNWCGQNIEMAFQCRSTDLKPSLESGDILFCRRLQPNNWHFNIVNSRIYVFVTSEEVYVARTSSIYGDKIIISTHSDIPNRELAFGEIKEIWVPQHKWSSQIDTSHQASSQIQLLEDLVVSQKISITQLNESIGHLRQGEGVLATLSETRRATAVPHPVSI